MIYLCYYCTKSSDEDLLPHMLLVHLDLELDSTSGVFIHRTKYFGVKYEFIQQKLDSGRSVQVYFEYKRLAIRAK